MYIVLVQKGRDLLGPLVEGSLDDLALHLAAAHVHQQLGAGLLVLHGDHGHAHRAAQVGAVGAGGDEAYLFLPGVYVAVLPDDTPSGDLQANLAAGDGRACSRAALPIKSGLSILTKMPSTAS